MTFPFPIQLAWYALRGTSSAVFKWMAIDLINRGHEAPELDELAWEPAGRQSEALFIAAAKRIGLAIPTREEAQATLIRYYIQRMTQPQCEPLDELQEMMTEVCRGWEMKAPTQAHDIAALVTASQAHQGLKGELPDRQTYRDLTGPAALEALSEDVHQQATAWLARHPAAAMESTAS